ncbi:MAG: hypothetical protein OEZ54_08220 [Gemmatimonadota bacterium]|nr:hypothetical protein [Gemmatimonadota bacterium]
MNPLRRIATGNGGFGTSPALPVVIIFALILGATLRPFALLFTGGYWLLGLSLVGTLVAVFATLAPQLWMDFFSALVFIALAFVWNFVVRKVWGTLEDYGQNTTALATQIAVVIGYVAFHSAGLYYLKRRPS